MNLGGSIRINKCGVLILVLILLLFLYYLSGKSSSSSYSSSGKNQNEINIRKLLIGSIQASQKGGQEVVDISKKPDFQTESKGKTKEGANDPVTKADFNSHCVMIQGLHRIFPKLKIVSEEDGSDRKCPEALALFDLDPTVLHENAVIPDEIVNIDDLTVYIDPLDATQEFTEKLFEYVTTMVCVAHKGAPIIGVIHNPFTQKTVWAWVGKAYSEELLNVKREEEVRNPIMIISRSHTGDANEYIKQTFGDNSHAIKAGGAGYKVLQVAFNNATAYIHKTVIKKWDICAGNAILNAIGGKMTNLQNEDISYAASDPKENEKGLLATAVEAVHKLFIQKIMEK